MMIQKMLIYCIRFLLRFTNNRYMLLDMYEAVEGLFSVRPKVQRVSFVRHYFKQYTENLLRMQTTLNFKQRDLLGLQPYVNRHCGLHLLIKRYFYDAQVNYYHLDLVHKDRVHIQVLIDTKEPVTWSLIKIRLRLLAEMIKTRNFKNRYQFKFTNKQPARDQWAAESKEILAGIKDSLVRVERLNLDREQQNDWLIV